MNDLTDPAGLVALAAGGRWRSSALVLAIVLAVKLRRLRAAQEVVLGASGRDDLVAHASRAAAALRGAARRASRRSPSSSTSGWPPPSDRLDGAIAYRALVRYDAYGELSGHQSTTLALLDADHNGVVLSCDRPPRHRAPVLQAGRHDGRGEHQLSPEEDEAIRLALAGARCRAP